MKPRPESLFAKLATADPSLALREWVFYSAIVEGKGLEEIGGHLADNGVQTSVQAISKMIQTRGLRFRLDQAREAARAVTAWTPDKKHGSISEQTKQSLRKQMFDASMQILSVKEMVAIHKAMLTEMELGIRLYNVQEECAGIIAEVLRGGSRAEDLKELAQDKGLTGKEYIEAIRQRVYGDLAAEVPVAEERGAA